MAYISYSSPKVGDWVITKKVHKSMSGKFTVGSRVQVIGINPMRGYDIQDEEGHRMLEIGWEI